MTDAHRPDAGKRRLQSLLDDAPGSEPPEWLDANIRAAAAQAAEVARQRGHGASVAEGGEARRPRRINWIPIGATMAVAVLGLMLVISAPVDRGAHSPEQEQARARDEVTRQSAPAKAADPTNGRSAPALKSRADAATSNRDAPASGEALSEAPPTSSAKRESGQAAGAALGSATAPAAAPPAAPQALERAREVALPDNATACSSRIDELRRGARADDARRLFKACRERFPEHAFPAEMVRELAN